MLENNLKTKRIVTMVLTVVLVLTGCGKSPNPSVLISEIRSRSDAAGFLAEKAEENRGFISNTNTNDASSDYAYVYDNALAVIVLTLVGAQNQAELIADAIVFAQEHDRTFRDGRIRNVYIPGDPKSDSGRSITGGNVTIRLPGFWQNGKWQEDFYTVSTSTGNMAWMILALCFVSENASVEKRDLYIRTAINAADFVLTMETEEGFTAGYEGWDNSQTKAAYISTEHNIDVYVAFSILSQILSNEDPEKAQLYKEAAQNAKSFVLSMYDAELGCFYTGTLGEKGTLSDGVIPLDANSLAVLAFGKELEDPHKPLSFVERRMAVGEGFDYSAGDLDGIWNEGTAQMAICYLVLGNSDKYKELMQYLKTQIARDGSIPAADRDGVSTGFIITGTDLFWEYDNVQSISATSWLALAQMGINPFESIMN